MKTDGSTSSAMARAMKLASTGHTVGVSSARSSIPLKARMKPSKNCSLPYTLVRADSSTLAISLSAFFFSRESTRIRLTTSCPNLASLSAASWSSASRHSGLAKKSSSTARTFRLKAVMGSGSFKWLPTSSCILAPRSAPATSGADARNDSGMAWSSRKWAMMAAMYSTALGTSISRSSSCLRRRSTPASACELSTAPRCTSDETSAHSMSRSLAGLSMLTVRILQTSSGVRSPAPSSSML
mmetsp:Transcript_31758/g.61990  ORF Transcript_31758/g.61990 Transcript_31758/m.61990 type:complete len:241 (+) Transcript_31758:100-822(+)